MKIISSIMHSSLIMYVYN